MVSLVSPDEIRAFMGLPAEKRTLFAGKLRPDDWDDEQHIVDLYEMFLQAAQQNRVGLKSEFEEWLQACIRTQEWQINMKLPHLLSGDQIDHATYEGAIELARTSISAIRHYLEKPEHERLIGI